MPQISRRPRSAPDGRRSARSAGTCRRPVEGRAVAGAEALEARRMFALDAAGWTVLAPGADSRVIYVDNTPLGPGLDTNDGSSPEAPVATWARAASLVRSGQPDWILLKRGTVFAHAVENWSVSGRSPDEPLVIGAYGDPTAPRPRFVTGESPVGFSTERRPEMLPLGFEVRNVTLRGLEFTPGVPDTTLRNSTGLFCIGAAGDLLVEDCVIHGYQGNVTLQTNNGPLTNVTIRRSVIADAYAANSSVPGQEHANRTQGLYAQGVNGLRLEQNVFDHNGWSDSVPGSGPNMYSHNVYLQGDNAGVVVQGNVIANASAHGLQARAGGLVRDNLLLNNPFGMSFGYVNGAPARAGGVAGEVADNVILGTRDVPWTQGEWGLEIGNTRPGGGTRIHHNLIRAAGTSTGGDQPGIALRVNGNTFNPADDVGINDLTLDANTVYGWSYGLGIDPKFAPGGTGITALNGLTLRDNALQRMTNTPVVNHPQAYAAAVETWDANAYDTAQSGGAARLFSLRGTPLDLAGWQAAVEPTARATRVAYADPTRSAATYNRSIGGVASDAAFLSAARAQSQASWDERLTAAAVNAHLRAGFAPAEPAPQPIPIRAVADAYARDGKAYAGLNYGGAAQLVVKRHTYVGNTRESYLRFDIKDFAGTTDAKLRLVARSNSSAEPVGLGLFTAGDVTWPEKGLTWNTRPATSAAPLGSRTVAGTTAGVYEFDVTAYVQQQKVAGAAAVTFVLKGTGNTDAQALIESDESSNAAARPQLVVVPTTPPPPPAPVQALVVSASQLAVPEGGAATFTVKLATQPAADVVVAVVRTAGDADLGPAALAVPLTFTAADWHVAQTVQLTAAHDADALNGSATFTLSAAGLVSQTVTATETDDEVPPPPAPALLRAAADAYVRDGATYATQNFGAASQLQLKRAAAGWNRESVLRFDLSGVTSVSSARLRLFGRLDNTAAASVGFAAYASGDLAWGETTVNWNNRPSSGTTALASAVVIGTAGAWCELDLTAFLQQQKAAGATLVTLVLKAAVTSDSTILLDSDEGTNRPELLVTA